MRIDTEAVYDDGDLVLGLGLTHAALLAARKSGALRYARVGQRTLYRGEWLKEWLERTAEQGARPAVVSA